MRKCFIYDCKKAGEFTVRTEGIPNGTDTTPYCRVHLLEWLQTNIKYWNLDSPKADPLNVFDYITLTPIKPDMKLKTTLKKLMK